MCVKCRELKVKYDKIRAIYFKAWAEYCKARVECKEVKNGTGH